jgi:hypothetical protein
MSKVTRADTGDETFRWWFRDAPHKQSIEAIETDRGPRKTGILDASGRPIYAADDRQPIGFIRFGGAP